MAPISSGSSTWTSSGIPFSFVSMATGMGPSSSGSQATVASVVTSTLLAGLGFGGGGLPSFPSSVWPTRLPTAPATSKQAGRPPLATTEAAASPGGPDGDPAPTKHGEGAEDGGKDEKGESEDGEREHEEEGEKDAEKKDRGGATRAPRGRGREEPTAAPSPPSGTAQGGGPRTTAGRPREHSAAPTDRPGGTPGPDPGLRPNAATSAPVPPTAVEERHGGTDPSRPGAPSEKAPVSRGDRFSEDSKFITVNPGKRPRPSSRPLLL